MAIRTGSDDYTKWLMTNQEKGGALPDDMTIKDGWLWEAGIKLPTLTEQDFFSCIETEWIRPQQRSKGNWRK
jgi:hypothetical protein